MPFAGVFPRVLDEKRRVSIPKLLRDEMGQPAPRKLFITQGSFRSLWIVTPDQLNQWGERMRQDRSDDAQQGAYRRLFYARAEASELDKQGRVLIPDRLTEYAGLGTEVLLVGVYDHIQLWQPQRWADYERSHEGHYDATAERMFITKL